MTTEPRTLSVAAKAVIVAAVVIAAALVAVLLVGTTSTDTTEPAGNTAVDDAVVVAPVVVTVGGAPLAAFPAQGTDPAAGTTAPDITIIGATEGLSRFSAQNADGNHTLVVAAAHWCGHCNVELPAIIQAHTDNEISEDLDIVIISTAQDPTGDNFPDTAWLDDIAWFNDDVMYDTDNQIADAFGVVGFPQLTLLDPDGAVVSRSVGRSSTVDLAELLALSN